MDLDRMLDMCRRDQWSVDDLDWTQRPRELSRDDEMAIVQLFTDMAGIERLAGALFEEQERRAKDARLQAIFRTFVVDEERHAQAAERLARFYDVHGYREYRLNESLVRFRPYFMAAVKYLSDEIANAYITGGELILDVALLRSLDDFVHDGMSAEAMKLINRDESRHIAVDYHMVEHYASPEYSREADARPKPSLGHQVRALWAIGGVLYHAGPFFRGVFFQPMERVDPTGRRLREAFKRMQLMGAKPGVNERPFGAFMKGLSDLFNHPVAGPLFGTVLARLAGVEPALMKRFYTDDEWQRASRMTFDELAQEALGAKLALTITLARSCTSRPSRRCRAGRRRRAARRRW
jgi:hypothetical protein